MDFMYIHFNQIKKVECIKYKDNQKLVVNRGIHSFRSLSCDRVIASSKASSAESAIWLQS